MAELDPMRWKALAVVCAAFFMTVLDVSIVNVALPSIGRVARLLAREPPVGDHRVRDHVRRLPAARRPRRRPARPAARLPRRRRALHDRVVPLRPRVVEGVLIARARSRASARRSSRRPRSRSSRRRSTKAPSATRRSGSGARWAARGAAVGVLAGGVLTKYLGWEWIFFVNVPVGVPAFLLAPRFVRESRSETGALARRRRRGTVDGGAGAARLRGRRQAPDHGWGTRPGRSRASSPSHAQLLGSSPSSSRGPRPADAVLDLPRAARSPAPTSRPAARRRRLRQLLHPDALRAERARLRRSRPGSRSSRRQTMAIVVGVGTAPAWSLGPGPVR